MRNAKVVSIETGPDLRGEKILEGFTCHHCQQVTFVKPRCDPAELGGHCKVCDKLVCKDCVGKECTPFMKKIEREEAKAAAYRGWF